MTEPNDILFRAPAKWEQNFFCHSPGHLQLSNTAVEFLPGMMSVLGKHLKLPIESIDSVKAGDNFLWRGVVHILLSQPILNRTKYIFFLGGKRKKFISIFESLRKGSN